MIAANAPTTPILNATVPDIFISEFLPNPAGSDNELEFIEIFNNENYPVDLTGWQLDDEEGGSKPYTIDGIIIKPNEYLAFFRPQTKIALNNNQDSVRLFTPDNQLIDQTNYDKTQEGFSYVKDPDDDWQQSPTPTPNEINVLPAIAEMPTGSTSTPELGKILGAENITDSKESQTTPFFQSTNKLQHLIAIALVSVLIIIVILVKLTNRNKK